SRGFSFRFDAPLDMRMNQTKGITAAEVVNSYDEERLASIFYLYGELKNGRQLAQAIIRKRDQDYIDTTGKLVDIVRACVGREREKKEMAKVFQALRMEVNHEVDALREMLLSTLKILKPGGKLVIITYHSIEDRMVKNLMKSGNLEGNVETDFYGNRNVPFKKVLKPIVPDMDEQNRNPRSRSAKLRVAEKI
ncbi:MAG: 16S rRNA (cytosine(1402)-N(4))-methyltransferase RsmH, partial [Bacteroidaceae bacterium]|nr:16S rRNA (cytosine(1402)-N(4))-methyltransferase RsmH [Bacteroidaceae bacterium]